MPKNIITTVYEFDELSDKAKEKAREWFRQYVFQDSSDWEFVYQDANTSAELMGITIAQRKVESVSGKTFYEPEIYYSGFWSQGDGACFKGNYAFVENALARVAGHAPVDEELHRIASEFDRLQAKYAGRITASVTLMNSHYSHSNTMQVDSCFVDDDGDELNLADEDADGLQQLMRDFANWIYRQLEKEYNYQSSDETIDDNIRANEYTFTENGKREG